MARKEYSFGEYVGSHGVIFLEEIEPERKIAPSGRRHTYRRAKFLCPSCKKPYEARLENVQKNKSTQCSECGHKQGAEKIKKKYSKGDIIGPNKDVIFIEEVEPINCYDHIIRRGKFYNKKTNIEFETDIRLVVTGSSNGDKKSSGECILEQILLDMNIEFETQKMFKECKDISYLRFDFYLPEYNCCIEYDGIQHFKVTGWNTEKKLLETQKRDEIKNNYCQNYNIGLIRISYQNKKKLSLEYLQQLLNKTQTQTVKEVIYA